MQAALTYSHAFLLRENDRFSVRSGTENAHKHTAGREEHNQPPLLVANK